MFIKHMFNKINIFIYLFSTSLLNIKYIIIKIATANTVANTLVTIIPLKNKF